MTYPIPSKQLLALIIIALLFIGCEKEVDRIGDRGQTIVKFIDGGHSELPSKNNFKPGMAKHIMTYLPQPLTITAADVRRDVPNNKELNRLMHVTVIDDTAALRVFNDSLIMQGGSPYVYLRSSYYTINNGTPKLNGEGGFFNLVLQPGEFAKPIFITILNPSLLDPSVTYALPFRIMSADADGRISFNNTVFTRLRSY